MNRREFLSAAAAATLAGPGFAQVREAAAEPGDLPGLAEKVAKQAAGLLAGKVGAGGRVAVFPPGDSDGKLTLHIQQASRILQGELIYNLINLAQGRFAVLDKAALAQAFAKAKVDAGAIDRADAKKTAGALAKLGLDAALFGSFGVKKADFNDVKTTLQLVFKDGTPKSLGGTVEPQAIPPARSSVLARVRPEIWLTPEGQPPRKLPIFTTRKPGTEYDGVLFAALPADLAWGTKAAQYKVRLRNTGEGANGITGNLAQPDPRNEKRRLFGVALAVDGVNSAYQDRGDGKIGPVMVHPQSARRWLLTGPGLQIGKHGPRPTDWHLDQVGGPGHSQIDVAGFQSDADTSLTFTFAEPHESVAAEAGATGEVGCITAVVFAQKMRGDQAPPSPFIGGAGPGAGTKAGPARRNPTVRIQVDIYPIPVAEYRIFYRPESEIPIPADDRADPWAQGG